jgi:hypothetical protein
VTAPSDEREILERTVRAIADRARDAYRVVEEAHAIESKDESGLVSAAKQLRMELLQTKAELERELGRMRLAGAATGRATGSVASVPSPGTGRTRNQRRTVMSRVSRRRGLACPETQGSRS